MMTSMIVSIKSKRRSNGLKIMVEQNSKSRLKSSKRWPKKRIKNLSKRSLMPLLPTKSSLLDMEEEVAEVIVVAIVGAKEVPHVVAVAEDSEGIKSVTSSKAKMMTTSCIVRLPTNLNVTSRRRKI